MLLQTQVGPVTAQDGTYPNARAGKLGDAIVSELNGRYFENTYRGNKFACSTAGGGVQLAATHLFSTAIGTFTPILALYNPLTSGKNFVINQAWCSLTAAPLATATQTGSFLWVVQSGQSISNAQTATPVNTFTLKASGSAGIGITNATLTGAVSNPIVLRPMSGVIEVVTATANATAISGAVPVEEVAGSLVIPPGGYAGFATGISNAVAGHLVTAGLVWDELPV